MEKPYVRRLFVEHENFGQNWRVELQNSLDFLQIINMFFYFFVYLVILI